MRTEGSFGRREVVDTVKIEKKIKGLYIFLTTGNGMRLYYHPTMLDLLDLHDGL